MEDSLSGAMPWPSSFTRTTMSGPSRRALTSMLPPGSVYLAAFWSRFATTWASRTGSPSTKSAPTGTSTVSLWWRGVAGGRGLSHPPVVAGVDERPGHLHRARDRGGQIDPLAAQVDLPHGGAGDVEQVVDQAGQVR